MVAFTTALFSPIRHKSSPWDCKKCVKEKH